MKSAGDGADKKATLFEFDRVLGLGLDKVKVEKIPAEVVQLADERQKARQAKDWQNADEIRKQIKVKGYLVEDTKDGFIIKAKS